MFDNFIVLVGRLIRSIKVYSNLKKTAEKNPVFYGEFLEMLKNMVSSTSSEFGLGVSLFSLVVSTQAKTIIEIGRFQGFSTLSLAAGLRFVETNFPVHPKDFATRPDVDYERLGRKEGGKLYSIDLTLKPHAEEVVKNNNLSEYVEFITVNSLKVDLEVVADILFIDGDHTYEGCRSDVAKYVPANLRPGGYFILHDYFGWYDSEGRNISPIKKVCDELIDEGKYQSILMDTNYMSFMIFKKPMANDE
jgi:hypothetical protein